MEDERDRSVLSKELLEFLLSETMGMIFCRTKCHKVNDIDKTQFELGQMLSQNGNCGERFKSRHISGTCKNGIGLAPIVRARPFNNADSFFAQSDRLTH